MKTRPESLLDYTAKHDGKLPDKLSEAMRQSSRDAFIRRKDSSAVEQKEPRR